MSVPPEDDQPFGERWPYTYRSFRDEFDQLRVAAAKADTYRGDTKCTELMIGIGALINELVDISAERDLLRAQLLQLSATIAVAAPGGVKLNGVGPPGSPAGTPVEESGFTQTAGGSTPPQPLRTGEPGEPQ